MRAGGPETAARTYALGELHEHAQAAQHVVAAARGADAVRAAHALELRVRRRRQRRKVQRGMVRLLHCPQTKTRHICHKQ
jgi:hypothetical protein